ncbi:hypothetical protein M7I_7923 [Glarea lozoyensis 74030]|uniref:Uncharacterized protein n=1 Tax=Glarea lozoyensis (strain ATCC 74030 / MF5533) TaxID=1104152 RepID=H0EYL7_GLAL7|nr:hypothetical protein M7I_7923 [Glarea lozoyensis 74030]
MLQKLYPIAVNPAVEKHLRIPSRYGKTIAYFRGRKLHGKAMKIPKGYRGVVLSTTDKILPKPQSKEHDEEDEEEFNEVKVVDEEATFDEFMVWGHEALPEEMADPYVRGMEEWIDFAKTIHAHDDEELDVGVGGKAK